MSEAEEKKTLAERRAENLKKFLAKWCSVPTGEIDLENLNHSNSQEAVVEERLRILGTDRYKSVVRKSYHASLLKMLDSPQEEAMYQIYYGFLAFGAAGMGCKIGQYGERLSPATGDVSRNQDLALLYGNWSRTCMRDRLSPAMALDVIVYGKSMRQVDKDRRQRTGSAKANFLECMDVYCKLRGWKR